MLYATWLQLAIFVPHLLGILVLGLAICVPAAGQEAPYFVTYDHHLEEPGNLEIESSTTIGIPRKNQHFYFAPYGEIEYGVLGRLTSELYLEAQATAADSAVFTGWRLENRFRPLRREHRVNPVLYLEYENLNEASRIQKEIVGTATDWNEPNSEASQTRAHELEAKLILSSDVRDWNVAGNFIVEKNVSAEEGLEFGYAAGVSRPLSTIASGKDCRLCRENFALGAEIYGGLGSTAGFGFHDTAQYLAPVVRWQLGDNSSLRFSPAFGLTHGSNAVLLRFGYSYEVRGFGSKLASMFRGGR
jgi:hypothetical protein